MERREILYAALLSSRDAILKTKELDIAEKQSAADLITAADLNSQAAAEGVVLSHSRDQFLSEEKEGSLDIAKEKDWTGWIIDPIDGTNNFVRGIPFYCISLAYIEKGEPALGGILDPVHNDYWFAEKNGGARRNNQVISVSPLSEIGPDTRVCSSTSYEPHLTLENLQRYSNLGDVWVDFLSSAALDFAYLADGRIDLFHHNGLKPWDNAAGFLIAQEAGAKITSLDGSEASWYDAEIVAGNPRLVDHFLSMTNG